MNVTVSNVGEPAYFAWINLNFSRVFSFVGRQDDVKDILCDLVDEVSINCNLGNPFLKRTEVLQFKLVPLYSAQMPSDVMFTTNISTTSDNILEQDMTISQQFSVVRRSEVSIRGSIRPEVCVDYQPIRTQYQLLLTNHSSVSTSIDQSQCVLMINIYFLGHFVRRPGGG